MSTKKPQWVMSERARQRAAELAHEVDARLSPPRHTLGVPRARPLRPGE